MHVLRLIACATLLTAACAAGHAAAPEPEPEPDECTPPESAHCAGAAHQAALNRSKAAVETKYRRLIRSLPEEPFDQANLPSQASMAALHRAWQGYVASYCNVYWYLWTGASTWKSAEAVACAAGAHQRYEVFLDEVQACTAPGSGCTHLAQCTPLACQPRKR